ncbi:MAG TPA: PhzF family phenazine biosynthesis protein [Vicinamibacterales bacterium]|nr:PhzF family phenazine biosynthesis protein [Vicinamibacterales bacterium]
MRSYRFLQLDVFTDHLFGGNQLAVFPDGRGLSSGTMQAIAKEMNFSETTFVLPAEDRATDVRMRIFTPGAELPMAGHPTIGTTFALARTGAIAPGRDRIVFGLGVGPTPVTMIWADRDLSFAWMTQAQPVFSEAIADRACAAAALSVPLSALATAMPVQVVSCGLPYLLVPFATRQGVDSAALNRSAYDRLAADAAADVNGVFLFSTEPATDTATAYSRMFAPAVGVHEDPATGSASGPLGCYLVQHKAVRPETADAMLSLQGVRMGRPSHVHISIGVEGTDIRSVRVGGSSVLAGEGTLYIP